MFRYLPVLQRVAAMGSKKRPLAELHGNNDAMSYKFKVLLRNGSTLDVSLHDPPTIMPIRDFVIAVKQAYFKNLRHSASPVKKMAWSDKNWYVEDLCGNKETLNINFQRFSPYKCHILRLLDGSAETENSFENMWDLTPDTNLLMELPKEYTLESALADLIDNSLQAVWCNNGKDTRLIRVDIKKDKISIFDTGPGMDGSEENSIENWGKMGASINRSCRRQAIGVKPPYLVPFFGMFGYGGSMAVMHLGRHALVSSKTKESKKVMTLHLERDALLNNSGSEHTWHTDGGIRDPSEQEVTASPHGSFTKVEIFEPKLKSPNIYQLQCRLKDIYFPYIQCDETSTSGKTIIPVQFQVNGTDLAEIEGGEVATSNLHSCNGPNFVVHLRLNCYSDNAGKSHKEAHARLKCVYFPIVEGKECIEKILDQLISDEFRTSDTYETYSRVSIRRLGRLLPDARWARLPFMEPRIRKGDRAEILKRSCSRVKCFIETDAGFDPTPYKSDLAHHHPYTIALKNFGNKSEKNEEVNVEIYKDEKPWSLLQLENKYEEWIFQMHGLYDEEMECGEDEPALVVNPLNKKKLCISSDVFRVHKVVKRKGAYWKHGQKIKILKGACTGFHKNSVYATLEYIMLEGLQGDAGQARIICRPLHCPEKNGSTLLLDGGNCNLEIGNSVSLPISVIDSGKCLAIESAEWESQVEKVQQKAPSAIDILSNESCEDLDLYAALPAGDVFAGHAPPSEIVAVVRPSCFSASSGANCLDQKYIVKDHQKMVAQIKFIPVGAEPSKPQQIYSTILESSSHKGLHGLYIFTIKHKFPELFQKAGVYIFSYTLKNSDIKNCERRILVQASTKIAGWKLLESKSKAPYTVRVGSCFPEISIIAYDEYDNLISFANIPELALTIEMRFGLKTELSFVKKSYVDISYDNGALVVKDLLIETDKLDKIRPSYEASLVISAGIELSSLHVPCLVLPGILNLVKIRPSELDGQLLPDLVVEDLIIEVFDAYGNHINKGSEVLFNLDGFRFQDKLGLTRKVDEDGCIDLSGLVKVTAGYGKSVSMSVVFDTVVVFKKVFQVEDRKLRAASGVSFQCYAGSQLENVSFEVVNSEGIVDESIHDEAKYGQFHTLTMTSELFNCDNYIRYAFQHGHCIIPSISIPEEEGEFFVKAAHSRHPELNLRFKIHVLQAQEPKSQVMGELTHFHCSDGGFPLLEYAPEHEDRNNLELLVLNLEKGIESKVQKYGLLIGKLEAELRTLHDQKKALQLDMSQLQESLGSDSMNSPYLYEKEAIMERIERKENTAAGLLCSLSRRYPFQDPGNIMKDIVGIVALLGTVRMTNLSRILAQYMGEDQMLAVVCTSSEAASELEKYQSNGDVDHGLALYAIAASMRKRISGRFLVSCLEDMRVYDGRISNCSQRKLMLPDPTTPTGELPSGFMGYAVNMINMDSRHLEIVTAAGHGLRETLFYNLVGHLHVFDTRENMKRALQIIKSDAVSLDGGIMRQSGFISLGFWEPDVCFPVVVSDHLLLPSSEAVAAQKKFEELNVQLRKKLDRIDLLSKHLEDAHRKFQKKKFKYIKFRKEKGPSIIPL